MTADDAALYDERDDALLRADRAEDALDAALVQVSAVKSIRDRMDTAEGRVEALTQAMFDAYAILGFDTDGDTNPAAWIAGAGSVEAWTAAWLDHVREARKDHDDCIEEVSLP